MANVDVDSLPISKPGDYTSLMKDAGLYKETEGPQGKQPSPATRGLGDFSAVFDFLKQERTKKQVDDTRGGSSPPKYAGFKPYPKTPSKLQANEQPPDITPGPKKIKIRFETISREEVTAREEARSRAPVIHDFESDPETQTQGNFARNGTPDRVPKLPHIFDRLGSNTTPLKYGSNSNSRSDYFLNRLTGQYELKRPTQIALSDDDEPWTKPVITSKGSSSQRKSTLIQKLLRLHPEDKKLLLKPDRGQRLDVKNGIHVFVDYSNISIGYYNALKEARGIPRERYATLPRFSFHGLSLIMERGRPTSKRVLVGSGDWTEPIREADQLGYKVSLLDRVSKVRAPRFPKPANGANTSSGDSSSGGENGDSNAAGVKARKVEQAVDEIVHLKVCESLLDTPKPSTVVLASGDGALGEYSEGFFAVVERCLRLGWKVELVSFKAGLCKSYLKKDFRNKWGEQFKLVLLDEFVEELCGE